ncbi:MAG: single-stranded DNA-binding protein [Oscillospiraceae bacterium]|nr:single-stranded DNA-binding protein [Oscillospiraceae bacterium]
MLNHIVIMGRLTRDPELRYTQSQVPVASFTVAVDRDFGGRDGGERQTDFIDVSAWRSTGEFVSKYFRKGSMVVVSGRLQSRKWQDRDGNNRTSWEINADNVYFGESRRDSDSNRGDSSYGGRSNDSYASRGNDSYGDSSYSGRSQAPAPSAPAFDDLGDDDGELPF